MENRMNERLEKQMAFALEIDKAKNVIRQTRLSNHGRRENVAEHSWHMAMMVYILREYANEEIDVLKTILLCMVHDIVEIEAGDTYAYDVVNLETQKERENLAKEKIFSILPDDQKQEFIALFDEFDAAETPEAKFARVMDNLQPVMLNDSNGGVDWKERGLSLTQISGRQEKTKPGSQTLYDYSMDIIQKNIENGNIINE